MFRINRYKIGYSIAILIIIAAILSTLTRILAPYYLEQYHQEIENVISRAIKKQVEIDNMEVGWYWFKPVIKFSDVTVSDPDQPQQFLHVNQIGVAIKPLRSLQKKQLQPSVIYVSGSHLKVKAQADGTFLVEGFGQLGSQRSQNNGFRFDRDLQLNIPSQMIVLRDFEFDWQDKDGKNISVKDFNLNLKERGNNYQISGRAIIDQAVQSNIHFTGSAKRNFQTANIYLDAQDMQVNQWLQDYDWNGLTIKNGLVSTQFWLSIEDSNVVDVRSIFDLNGIDISGVEGNGEQYLHHLSGQLHWTKSENGWTLRGDRINLETGNVNWQNNYFKYTFENTRSGPAHHFSVEQLNIELILPYLYHAEVLPEKLQEKMVDLDPHGDFSDVQVDYLDDEEDNLWEVQAQFENLHWKNWDNIPGVEGLTGAVDLDQHQGILQLNSNQVVLDFDNLFESPIDVDTLNTELSWAQSDSGWSLKANKIEADNADAIVRGQFSLDIPSDGSSPTVNIEAHGNIPNIARAKYFLPMKILPEKLGTWLQDALHRGGQAESIFLLRGKLSDFPFDNNDGVFIVDTDVTNLDLNYFNDWPHATNLNANLVFNKRDMHALVKSGNLQDNPVSNFEVTILQIGNGEVTLDIHGLIHGESSQGVSYMRNTPLIEKLPVFNMLDVNGPMALQLDLKIPLYAKAPPVEADGSIYFNNNDVEIPDLHIKSTQTNGELYFNESGVVDSQFNGNFLDHLTTFSVKTEGNPTDETDAYTQVEVAGRTDIHALSDQFSLPISDYTEGETDYQANVKIYSQESDLPNEISVSSNLKGVAINFPAPLGKDADQSTDFHLLAQMADDQDLKVQFNLADDWSTYLLLNPLNPGYKLDAGEVRIGSGQALAPQGHGISVIGSVPSLVLDHWYSYIQKQDDKPDETIVETLEEEESFASIVQSIDLRIGEAYLLGQQFDNVDLNAVRDDAAWNLTIDSDSVSGNIRLSDEVEGHLKNLYLQKISREDNVGNTSSSGEIHLPPFDVVIDDFRAVDYILGRLTLVTHSGDENQVVIDRLSLQSPDYTLSARGEWDLTQNQEQTRVNGNLDIINVKNLIQTWDLPPRFNSRSGEINFDLMWDDSPAGFAIEKLNGDLVTIFRYGQVTDLNRSTEEMLGVGKIFSLLNLNTLPRRLQLDFSDLSNAGYSFDIFRGDTHIDAGRAKINEAFLEGPVAYIGIEGNIGIVDKDYNLRLRVVPHVTSSLPIVATVLGGPIVGAVTFVADKVVEYSFREVSPYNYRVTGSWEEPEIQELEDNEAGN